MPIYVYECPNGHQQENVQTVAEATADPRPPCPECSEQMHRVPSSVSVSFRGSGFTPKFYPNRKGK